MKRKLFSWICHNILLVEEGAQAPAWICWLFFPLMMFYFRQTKLRYNLLSNSIWIEGLHYNIGVFTNLAKMALDKGTFFQLVRRENGQIIIKKFEKVL